MSSSLSGCGAWRKPAQMFRDHRIGADYVLQTYTTQRRSQRGFSQHLWR